LIGNMFELCTAPATAEGAPLVWYWFMNKQVNRYVIRGQATSWGTG